MFQVVSCRNLLKLDKWPQKAGTTTGRDANPPQHQHHFPPNPELSFPRPRLPYLSIVIPAGVVGTLCRLMYSCMSGKLFLIYSSALLSQTVPKRKPWDGWWSCRKQNRDKTHLLLDLVLLFLRGSGILFF